MSYGNDSNTIIISGVEGRIWTWDREKKLIRHVRMGHRGPVLALGLAQDGKSFASGGVDTSVIIWDMPNPKVKER